MIRLRRTFVQIELDRCDSFGRFRVGGLDLPENLALVAQQDHAPAAAHPLGELRRAVFN